MRRRKGYRARNTVVTLAHTEYITDIHPSQEFTMQIDEPVQPGLPYLFPWLNTIARNFETYKILKLVFLYKSTSADAVLSTTAPSGSTSLGSVIMMAQYNVLADPPENKREMLNNATATSCKPSNSMAFSIKTNASYKTLFIRTPYTPSGGDRRLYDHCDFHLATEGMQATAGSIGELSVTIVAQFQKPTLVNEVDPLDLFNWNQAYTPSVAGNAFTWLQYTSPTVNTELESLPQSTMNGYLAIEDETGLISYFFPDSTDNQIGSVYSVSITCQCVPTLIGAQIFHHEYFSDNLLTVGNMRLHNCSLVLVGGMAGGTSSSYFQNTGSITTAGYTANPTVPILSRTISANFYLQIKGPGAWFAPDYVSNPNAQVYFRAFQANGTPYAPTGGMNFNHKMVVSRIQYSSTG